MACVFPDFRFSEGLLKNFKDESRLHRFPPALLTFSYKNFSFSFLLINSLLIITRYDNIIKRGKTILRLKNDPLCIKVVCRLLYFITVCKVLKL